MAVQKEFTVDQTFFDQTTGNQTYFDDIPSSKAIYLDADGNRTNVGGIIYAYDGMDRVTGIFNGNSAHPFENPSALVNFIQMLSIFSIGAGLTWCFGKAVGNTRQGWAIFSAMLILFLAGTTAIYAAESAGNQPAGPDLF